MKKNIVTMFLSVSVIVVWAIVIYRIFYNSPDKPVNFDPKEKKVDLQSKEVRLSLKYVDPFKMEKKDKEIADVVTDMPIVNNPPNFRYKGVIKGGDNRLIIIEENGANDVLELKDSINGYKVLKVYNDSIRVSKDAKIYNLLKE